MRKPVFGFLGVAVMCASVAIAQPAGVQSGAGRGDAATTILERAPRDHAIAIPKEKLAQYLKDMDVKKLSTLRMIEGGKYNVNIRRITNAETALVHPITIDVWYVIEGAGTLTTGGRIENGKIVGGESHSINPGDVEFIPAGLPHGVSGVDGNITWLNVRWDVDWPAGAAMGAGNAPPAAGTPAGGGRGVGAGRGVDGAAARGRGGAGLTPLEFAPTDHAIHISQEKLETYRHDMETKKSSTLRMIEGGHFNVNIRRIHEPSTEYHDTTIDTWVILEGSGTANTGFSTDKGDKFAGNGTRVAQSGVDAPAKVGDIFFVPSHFTHGFAAVNGVMCWLNIRWDDNYGK
jgi:mannose-6-phosphate isomerase-like protein (cupin superfamily)